MIEKTSIRAELNLCFDNDFDVYSISKIVGIEAYDCKKRSETRINPITKQPNCGYWTVSTDLIQTFDSKVPINILIQKINSQIQKLKELLNESHGVALFEMIVEIENGEAPAIRFEKNFLEVVKVLNGEIDVVVSVY